ncbi:hypothetical protein JCM8097_004444 [Rhodosporidiobolus ruineniae]
MDLPPPARTVEETDALIDRAGSPFETQEKTVKGRRVRVYKNLPPSVRAFWLASQAFNDREFIVYENERLTFRETHARVAHFASLLHARGVKKGDRVAIAMRNLPEWIIAWYALHCLGAVGVAVNCWLAPDAFFHCLALTEPIAIFVDEERAKLLGDKVGELKKLGLRASFVVRSRGDLSGFERLEPALEGNRATELPDVSIEAEDLATIFFTSGTTSMPKGVLSTQRQYMSNRWNTAVGGARMLLRRGDNLPPPDPNAPQKSVLLTVPLFHVIGNQSFLQLLTAMGGKLVLMHKFSPSSAVQLLRREGITTAGGVPNMVMQIMDELSQDRDGKGWEGLKLEGFSFGGGPASERLPGEARRRFKSGLPGASQGYGLTEVNSVATGHVCEDYYRRPTSCGLPPPAVSLKIIPPTAPQPASAAPALKPGEVGEICIHGPGVAEGYYRDEEATRKAFDAEGWFRTGDLGYLDEEGFLFLVDRAKDIIIRSGENISSVQVENALYQHPAVKEAAVVAVPCEVHGEQVAAVVVLHPPSHASRSSSPPLYATSLRAHAAQHLPRHALPALILFPPQYAEADEGLPKNATGKVLKDRVKEVAREEWEKSGLGRKVRAKL